MDSYFVSFDVLLARVYAIGISIARADTVALYQNALWIVNHGTRKTKISRILRILTM